MRWMTSHVIVLSLFAFTASARAEDPLLRSIDAMMNDGHCVSAITLLEFAEGSRASLMGRRALCEARLGRAQEATLHVAEALRSPNDTWVIAHRAELIAALQAPEAAPARSANAIPPAPMEALETASDATVIANPYYYASADLPDALPHASVAAPPVPSAYLLPLVLANPYYLCE